MQVSKKFAAFIAFKTKDKMFYVFYYLTFRKCTLKQHLAQREYLRGVHMIPLYSPTITFNYHMHAIITRSWFETTLDYKLWILDPKIEEFPCLVHELSVTLTALQYKPQ